jgi:excisionase family DNA binding protein
MVSTTLVKAEIAAQAMGLSKYFLYRLAAKGEIPSYRAGKAIRFDIDELRAWMRTQQSDDGNER